MAVNVNYKYSSLDFAKPKDSLREVAKLIAKGNPNKELLQDLAPVVNAPVVTLLSFRLTSKVPAGAPVLRTTSDIVDPKRGPHCLVFAQNEYKGENWIGIDWPNPDDDGDVASAVYLPSIEKVLLTGYRKADVANLAKSFLKHVQSVAYDWVNHNSKKDLPQAWGLCLLHHYKNNESNALAIIAPHLHAAIDAGNYVGFLAVPKKYKVAYRLMVNVKTEVVEKLVGKQLVKSNKPLVVQRGTYTPLSGRVSSWTVRRGVFATEKNLKNIGLGRTYLGNWALLLVSDVDTQRDKFLFNPDTLPHYLKTGNYGAEREIVSTGPVKLLRVVAVQVADDSDAKRVTDILMQHVKT